MGAKRIPKDSVCCVCGSTHKLGRFPIGILCLKHGCQYRNYGRTFTRTTKDKNEFIVKDGCAHIILTVYKGNYKNEVLIDSEDVTIVSGFRWSYYPSSSGTGYAQTLIKQNGKRTSLRIHRLLMGLSPEDKLVVDHINGNGLDNRRKNLRVVSRMENAWNCHAKGWGECETRGVYKLKAINRFAASITVNGKAIYLGSFLTEEEAEEVRYDAELKYDGDKAPQYHAIMKPAVPHWLGMKYFEEF